MSLAINTNVNSMTSQRNAAASNLSLSTSIARLSSGLRVNSAKDDAAGLAIANRMDAQARGMAVAIRNANDGISLAQTAEGGLSTIGNMLQRMRELAVQATNATNTTGDLSALNQEYTQLASELNRIQQSTTFNGIAVLNTSGSLDFQVGAGSATTERIQVASGSVTLSGVTGFNTVSTGSASALVTTTATVDNSARIASIDLAIDAVNNVRANLGAVQSRFENTISNLRVAMENQSAARGRIVDADFAVETANLSRAQILQQAGVAMISQANQLPQTVLSLIR